MNVIEWIILPTALQEKSYDFSTPDALHRECKVAAKKHDYYVGDGAG